MGGAAVLAALGAVAISGAVTGTGGSPAGPVTIVRSAALSLHLPAAWRATKPPAALNGSNLSAAWHATNPSAAWHAANPSGAGAVPLRAAVAAASPAADSPAAASPAGPARLVAGFARDRGRLRRLLDAVSAQGVVRRSDRLGRLQVWRWSAVRLRGARPVTLFVGYTTRGPLVATCTPAAGARSGACDTPLHTLRLVGASPVPLRAVELVESRVHSTLQTLAAERVRSRHELATAVYAEDQARAATSLANSFGFASQTLASTPAPRGTTDLSGLATHLDRTAAAYRALGDAIVNGDVTGYDVARTEIGAREASLPEVVQAAELP